MAFLKEESESRGVAVVYCTRLRRPRRLGHPRRRTSRRAAACGLCAAVTDIAAQLVVVARAPRPRLGISLFCAVVTKWRWSSSPTTPPARTERRHDGGGGRGGIRPPAGVCVEVKNLTWSAPAARARRRRSSTTSRSICGGARARYLLVGANGAGKSTLLKLIGGKHGAARRCVTVLARPAFHDLVLNTMVALLSGDWTRTIASVGNGVPYQADFKISEMCVRASSTPLSAMASTATWSRAPRAVGRAPRSRPRVAAAQGLRLFEPPRPALLKLLRPSDLLLLDEVTTDLDLTARQALLTFLKEESTLRGVTVVYSTHIFDGLDDWPDTILHLAHGKVRYAGAAAAAPRAAATAE